MFGLLDNNDPPPRFSLSALLALAAGAAMCCWTIVVLIGVLTTGSNYLLLALLFAAIALVPAGVLACVFCCFAMYFKQERWAYLSFGLMGLPYILVVIYLIGCEIVRAVTR